MWTNCIVEMDSRIVTFAASIIGLTTVVVVAAVYARSCCGSRKQSEKKKKDEESVIERLTSNDAAIQNEEKCEQHELPSDVHSTSFVNPATQTEVQQDPVASVQQDRMESVRGLQNLGNTCYFNSTMQALVHTNLVFRDKLENLHKRDEFVQNVLKFFSSMQHDNTRPYSPNHLHLIFGKKSPKFADHRQHDSHECLRNFLDNVRKEERDNSGSVDKRKVLTAVDSVFGGHFMTVYICKECETPYHVCEALLDISLPIMIDEKDLAAMNSARGSNEKKSRTVKLQTSKIQTKHYASQTDDSTERKITKSPNNIKSTAVEDAIELKPSETQQYSKLDVALQQNTSVKSKTETTDRHLTNFNALPLASGYEFDVSFASNETDARSLQEEAMHEAEVLSDVINVSPTNVELENTSGGEIVEMFKGDISLTNPRMVDPDTESETISLDDKDKDAEESKTTFRKETDLGEVCQAKEPDTSKEDNKISHEKEEFRVVSDSEKLDENVENVECSSAKAESNLAEKTVTTNDSNHEPSMPLETEDKKEIEDHECAKSNARDNPTEIQECNERQELLSEELQHKEREVQLDDGQQHSHQTQIVQVQRLLNVQQEKQHKDAEEQQNGQHIENADPKEVGEENKVEQEENIQRVEQHEKPQELEDEERKEYERVQGQEQNEHDVEQAQQKNHTENDVKEDEDEKEIDEDDKEEDEEENDEQQNPMQDQKLEEQHDEKHLLNDPPERRNKGTKEQQGEQRDIITKLKAEVGEEKREQEVEVQRHQEEYEHEEEEEDEQEHEEQDIEKAPRKDDNKDCGENNANDDEKVVEKEEDETEEGQENQEQEQGVDQTQGKDSGEDDDKEVNDKEETEEDALETDEGAEEQQGGQHASNAKLEEELGEEQREQDVEKHKQHGASEDDEEDEEHQEQDKENSPRKDNDKDGDEDNEDEYEKDGGKEEKFVEEKAEVEGRENQKQEQNQAPDDVEEVEDKEETEGKDAAEKHKEEDEKENVVDKEKEVDERQNLQQKQELGESDFEVEEYASETRDLYRETVEKLMTPLSFSSPYLPNKETAISKHVTIDNCLMYFTRKEHIHKEYLCNPCYGKHLEKGGEDVLLTSATKQTMIFNPPAILTLHLKRFELKPGGSVKRTDMIAYGELLDIAPYCSSMCLRNDPPCQNIWYTLYGVVVHHGSTLKSGHYTAYVKIKDSDTGLKKFLQEKYFDRDLTRDQLIEMMQMKQPGETLKQQGGTWYCMNDSWFHKVPVAEVLNQEAYLLFYERMS